MADVARCEVKRNTGFMTELVARCEVQRNTGFMTKLVARVK